MATYVPNAADVTQPTEDKFAGSAALEFRTLKINLAAAAAQLAIAASSVALIGAQVNSLQTQLDLLTGSIGAGTSSVALAASLASSTGTSIVGYQAPYASSVLQVLKTFLGEQVSVSNFGAIVGDNPANAAANDIAFDKAWDAIKTTGGTLHIPPGIYWKATTWVCQTGIGPQQKHIKAYGAMIKNTAAVTGAAVQFVGAYNYYSCNLSGLSINHQSNTTAQYGFEGKAFGSGTLTDVAVELDGNKANYAAFTLGSSTPTVSATADDSNCFWVTFERCSTRQRSGNLATYADYGILLRGTANATTMRGCRFTSVKKAIAFRVEAASAPNGQIANGVLIDGNYFEGVGTGIDVLFTPPPEYAVHGLRIVNNRVESTDLFFKYTNGTGVASNEYDSPPFLAGNVHIAGSVGAWISNPNNQYIQNLDGFYFGQSSPIRLQSNNGPVSFPSSSPLGHLVLGDLGGTSSYSQQHLMFGVYHVWVDPATEKIFLKSSQPASSQDGAMLTPMNGSTSFSASTTKVVVFGPTLSSSNYRVVVTPNDNKNYWVTGKTTTQFTINSSASSNASVDWMLLL